MGYHECTLRELQTFARNRGIMTAAIGLKKPALAQLLLQADAERTFEKLFELPPEVRNIIYQFYVGDLGTTWVRYRYLRETATYALHAPAQPPLASISRQLRHEVLPIFYQDCRFLLDFGRKNKEGYRLYRRSREFLDHLSVEHLGNIRNLEIETATPECRLHTNLDHRCPPVKITMVSDEIPVELE
jgi:hypothetical protein